MRESLEQLCHEFILNRDAVKSAFPWESAYLYPVCATIFCEKGQRADIERMQECRLLVKSNTSAFHDFRGIAQSVTFAMLAADRDPEKRLTRALALHDAFRKNFWCSQYLPVASMMLSETVPEEDYIALATRTREIYDLMRKEHPFLTSSEDSVFAAMLALSKERDTDVILETERCHQRLKKVFFSSNAVQSLSHVLALTEGGAEEKCDRTVTLFQSLKENGKRYGTGYELATLGVLAHLPVGEGTDTRETLCAVDDFLKTQKGYKGIFGMASTQRLMHAGMIVTIDASGGSDTYHAATISGAVSMIAAQQAATVAAVAAATAASSSGSN